MVVQTPWNLAPWQSPAPNDSPASFCAASSLLGETGPEDYAAAYETCRDEVRLLSHELATNEGPGVATPTREDSHWCWEVRRLNVELSGSEFRWRTRTSERATAAHQELAEARRSVARAEAEAHRRADAAFVVREHESRLDTGSIRAQLAGAEGRLAEVSRAGERYRDLTLKQHSEIIGRGDRIVALEESNVWLASRVRDAAVYSGRFVEMETHLEKLASSLENPLADAEHLAARVESIQEQNSRIREKMAQAERRLRSSQRAHVQLQASIRRINPALASQLIGDRAPALRLASVLESELQSELGDAEAQNDDLSAEIKAQLEQRQRQLHQRSVPHSQPIEMHLEAQNDKIRNELQEVIAALGLVEGGTG